LKTEVTELSRSISEMGAISSSESGKRRIAGFMGVVAGMVVAFHPVFAKWLHFSLIYEHYAHLLVIPLVSGYLLYRSRQRLFSNVKSSWGAASGIAVPGLLLILVAHSYRGLLHEVDYLTIFIAGLVTLLISGYVGFLGVSAARAAVFPLLFLYVAVPIPMFLLDGIIVGLQWASAELAHVLFRVAGVPVLREGFVFVLPGVSIEVARECSGIRSSMALFVVALICGHFFLRTSKHKAALLTLIVPLLIVKNALRIVTLTLLAVYVNPSFLHGSLHRYGGILFFAAGLGVFGLLLRLLRHLEPRAAAAQVANSA
jgi:exosortase